MEQSQEVAVVPVAVADIAEPQTVLAIVDLELVVETTDDYLGETIAEGFQQALKLGFARCFPDLSCVYGLHIDIIERRSGSKIYTMRAAPSLKKEYGHLTRDVRDLKRALSELEREAEAAKLEAAKKTAVSKIVATIAALTTALNFGVALHTFGEKWGLVQDLAQQRVEQDYPATIIKVRQISIFPPPPEARGRPPNGDFTL